MQFRAADADALGQNPEVTTLPDRALTGKLDTAEREGNGLARTSVRAAILIREESERGGKHAKPFNRTLLQTTFSEAFSL